MPSKKYGLSLSKKEKQETKRAFYIVILIILSLLSTLLIEYMVEDELQTMKLPAQAILLGITIMVIICISVKSAKTK